MRTKADKTKKQKAGKLRKGFTTGAAAAAAAKAALICLFAEKPREVEICFLTGEKKTIPVYSLEKVSDNSCEALVIKDAGDDPDITHKAQIGARVSVENAEGFSIEIIGGKGVGKITKPGLELPVGEPAINPGPREMIQNEISEVAARFKITKKKVVVEVFVPKGEILAKKTLNARLGIVGGISILGTTGVVTPMSHDAYIATIKSGIAVADAGGINSLVFTTGRRSERFAMEKFDRFKPEAFIQTGDFFKASLDLAAAVPGISEVIYTIFFGKAVKMALGFEHTHAAKSELTLKKLSKWAGQVNGSLGLEESISSANTARHAFSFIYPDHPDLLKLVAQKIQKNAADFSRGQLDIRVIIFDFDGTIALDTSSLDTG